MHATPNISTWAVRLRPWCRLMPPLTNSVCVDLAAQRIDLAFRVLILTRNRAKNTCPCNLRLGIAWVSFVMFMSSGAYLVWLLSVRVTDSTTSPWEDAVRLWGRRPPGRTLLFFFAFRSFDLTFQSIREKCPNNLLSTTKVKKNYEHYQTIPRLVSW